MIKITLDQMFELRKDLREVLEDVEIDIFPAADVLDSDATTIAFCGDESGSIDEKYVLALQSQ